MAIRGKRSALAASAAVGLWAASPALGSYGLNTLTSFGNSNGANPYAGLTISGDTLYGTGYGGTDQGIYQSVVFSLPVAGGTPTVLASLSNNQPYGIDGPISGLMLSGTTLYGTVAGGGSYGCGAVFSVPLAGGQLTDLASFPNSVYKNGKYITGDPYGAFPSGGVTLVDGSLYGTTTAGGEIGLGVVYKVPLSGSQYPTVLGSFFAPNGTSYSSLASMGALYGTTYGVGGAGSVFVIPPGLNPNTPENPPTTVASFDGSNGGTIYGGLIVTSIGLCGTSVNGGANGDGEVFSVSAGTPTVLGSFNGVNGANPYAGVVQFGNTLYGTTANGGAYNDGTVFSVPLAGGTPTVLMSFNGTNGANPYGGLVLSGNTLYGTTVNGGANGSGTVFSILLQANTVTSGQTYHFTAGTGSGISVSTVAGLAIQAGGEAVVDPASNHANRQLVIISSPGLVLFGSAGNWTGPLDLTNNDLDLPSDDVATVTSEVAQGYNSGNWNGTGGIISSSAAADTTHLTALGVIQNNQSGTAIYTAANPFDGATPGPGDILVKYTYYGDANLDGNVDGSDYSRIDNGAINNLTGWYNGDFNYDGVVNGSDYTLIDNAYNTQGASLTTEVAATTAEIGPVYSVAVPEPVSLSMLAVSSIALLRRRPYARIS